MVDDERRIRRFIEVTNSQMPFLRSPHFLLICAVTLLWAFAFQTGIKTAYEVWVVSEIFNHCLLVLPVAAYLLFEKRQQLIAQPIKSAPLVLLLFLPLLFVQLFAEIGSLKILMHLASFIALPILIWAFLGHKATRTIVFPLFFILFAIPIGDQIIPALQELTTDIAVPMLKLTGVPVFRNGLYLDIPEGRFLVAEACSGISFLITSTVFGFLYSYLFFHTLKRRIFFVTFSVLLPIAANAARVYGIILTAHLTDMEHAVGADHIIYGGVFYAIILFLLVVIGEFFREHKDPATSDDQPFQDTPRNDLLTNNNLLVFGLVPVFIALQSYWLLSSNQIAATSIRLAYGASSNSVLQSFDSNPQWTPIYDDKLLKKYGQGEIAGFEFDFFSAFYDGVNGKLISSVHRLYDQQKWSLVSRQNFTQQGKRYQVSYIISPDGNKRSLVRWYKINHRHFANDAKAKLHQTWLKTTKKSTYGAVFMISTDQHVSVDELSRTDWQRFESEILNSY